MTTSTMMTGKPNRNKHLITSVSWSSLIIKMPQSSFMTGLISKEEFLKGFFPLLMRRDY